MFAVQKVWMQTSVGGPVCCDYRRRSPMVVGDFRNWVSSPTPTLLSSTAGTTNVCPRPRGTWTHCTGRVECCCCVVALVWCGVAMCCSTISPLCALFWSLRSTRIFEPPCSVDSSAPLFNIPCPLLSYCLEFYLLRDTCCIASTMLTGLRHSR